MSKYCVKKPYTVLVAVILVLVLGFVSFTGLQTELLPTFSLPYLMVITTYPGASPERVEASVTMPLESALGTVNGVENVTSTSSENFSMVMLEFEEDTNMDSAMVKVSSQLDQINSTLPDMCGTPIIMELSLDMMATMYVSVDYEGKDIYELSDFADEVVIPYLERQAGVANVSSTGLVEKSVEIRLNKDKVDVVNKKLLDKVNGNLADARRELNKALGEITKAEKEMNDGKAELEKQQANIDETLGDTIKGLNESIPDIVKSLRETADLLDNGIGQSIGNVGKAYKDAVKAAQKGHADLGMTADEEKAAVDAAFTVAKTIDPTTDVSGFKPADMADAIANNGRKLNASRAYLQTILSGINSQLGQISQENADRYEKEVKDAYDALSEEEQGWVANEDVEIADVLKKAESEKEKAEEARKTAENNYINKRLNPSSSDRSLEELHSEFNAAKAAEQEKNASVSRLTAYKEALDAQTKYQSLVAIEGSLTQAAGALEVVLGKDVGDTHNTGVFEVWQLEVQAAQSKAVYDAAVNAAKSQTGDQSIDPDQLREMADKLENADEIDPETGKLLSTMMFSGMNAQMMLGEFQITSGKTQIESGLDQLESAEETARDSANLDQLLNMKTLSGLIMAQNFDMPAGYIHEGDEQYLLKIGDAFESVDEIGDLLLIDNETLGRVTIRDVADVTVIDNSGESYARVNGNSAVVLSIFKGSTTGTSETAKNCLKAIEELEARYEGLRITPLMNQGDYIQMVVTSVLSNLVEGAFLAIIVLALFLKDIRPTLVVAFSIPLSVLCAIVLMYFTGINLNIISLSGLALGIGMLVDNSIVVIENIYRLRSRGVPAAKAAVQGAKQVAGAIVASTLTTVCVFLPLVFAEGITKQLMSDMGLTIGYSLVASLVVALSVVPSMSSTMLKNCKEKEHPWFDKFTQWYGKVLRFCLKVKILPIGISIALLVFSIWQITQMGIVLLPDMGSNQMSVSMSLSEDIDKDVAIETADEALRRMQEVDGVDVVGAMTSSGAGGILGIGGGGSADFTRFTYYIMLTDEGSRKLDKVTEDIQTATADLDCELNISSSSMDMGSLMASGMEIEITGSDIDKMLAISEDVMGMLEEVEGLTDISNGQEDGAPEIHVSINKDEAMKLNLTVATVFSQLAEKLTTSTTSTTLTMNGEEYDVIVVDETNTLTLDKVMDTEFKVTVMDENGASSNETHKLSEFATRREGKSVESIRRVNQGRTMSVSAAAEEGYNISLLSREVQDKLDAYKVPEGYKVSMGGETTMVNEMIIQMSKMIALALIFIYLVMVAQFQSLLSPFIVIFTIPLAFTGGLLGLLIANDLLSLVSLMGFLLLAGVVVNNGIVFVDYTNQLRIAGMEKHDALVATGITRMRPIFMTTLTTVLSMSIMVVSRDSASVMGRGMAIVVIGGLLYATLMTLFIVPVMYDIFFRKATMEEIDVGDDLDEELDEAAEFVQMMTKDLKKDETFEQQLPQNLEQEE